MRDQILNSIFNIFDKKNNCEININNKKLIYYSSKKENIWNIIINDNIILKKKSDLIVSYKCITCNNINIISTTQIIRKINKCSIYCQNCNINFSNIHSNKNINEIYKDSIIEFNTYPEEFKNSYLLNHLSHEDYNRIKPNIVSFCNMNKNDLDNYEYWNIYKINNNFTSIIYDKINNTIFKPNQPILKCEMCYKIIKSKTIEQFKNTIKILCVDCKSCNQVIKIKTICNLLNEKIIYYSKLELKFIKWCHIEGIILNNGPNIKYYFKEKEYSYRIHFKIGNIIIDMKQNKSNLHEFKMKAIDIYKLNNKCIYYFIYPANWNQKIKELKNNILPEYYINSKFN
jgi:hypothetical protein